MGVVSLHGQFIFRVRMCWTLGQQKLSVTATYRYFNCILMSDEIDITLPLISLNDGSNEHVTIVVHCIRGRNVGAIW
jgi:hypothetical protein